MNTRDTLDTQLNVFADFDPRVPQRYQDTGIVVLGNIDPELQMKVLDQIQKPELVILDTMNFWIEGKPEALKKTLSRVDVFILNDSEARLLSGDPNLVKSARIIREMGPKTLIIKKVSTEPFSLPTTASSQLPLSRWNPFTTPPALATHLQEALLATSPAAKQLTTPSSAKPFFTAAPWPASVWRNSAPKKLQTSPCLTSKTVTTASLNSPELKPESIRAHPSSEPREHSPGIPQRP